MVVAVATVGMMQMAIDEVVDVVAVGNGFVAAAGAVDMSGVMRATGVPRGAGSRVGGGEADRVFVDMTVMKMVQMAIVQIVDVIFMLDGGMTAAGGMLVGMFGMDSTGGHK